MSYFLKRLYGMYLASNQSGILNDLTCPEVHECPVVSLI